MKIAIMQPYLFPYIGYWQLINMVDEFILLDDVSFIIRGYINRNSILLNGKGYLFSIPLDKPSQNKLIKDGYDGIVFSKNDENLFEKKTLSSKNISYIIFANKKASNYWTTIV